MTPILAEKNFSIMIGYIEVNVIEALMANIYNAMGASSTSSTGAALFLQCSFKL